MRAIQCPTPIQAPGPGGFRGFLGHGIDPLRRRRPVVVTTIDVPAVLDALRAAFPPRVAHDF
jgi:hypothetical protein